MATTLMPKGGQQDFQSLVLSCNKDGMDGLRKGHYKAAFEQLKYAEAILIANQKEGENTSLLAVTCNNLGCYYKKVGKLHAALSYLRQALKVEVSLQTDDVTVAGTHLNICAILSKLEKHDKAVQHALCALELISDRVDKAENDVQSDDYSVLAIAYHNVALEREFLHQWDQAAMAYQKGFQVAKRCLGDQHPLTQTLGKNCDAVLQKSAKYMKDKSLAVVNRKVIAGMPAATDVLPRLPEIGGAQTRDLDLQDKAAPMPQGSSVIKDAVDFVADAEGQWSSFARNVLSDEPPIPTTSAAPPPVPQAESRDLPGALGSLAQMKDVTVPTFTGADLADPALPPKKKEQPPEGLMALIDADRDSHQTRSPMRSAPNDYRPNRLIRGSTRTSLVLRRTGMFNSTTHRDQVLTNNALAQTSQPWKSQFVQKTAAEKIQRCWRGWHKYCMEHQDWMTTTRICATMIQARWRSYHVRRQKLDKAAGAIQRHIRGFLVRLVLKRHTAAVTIQRHVAGMLTRKKLGRLNAAAILIQQLIRGGLSRKAVRDLRKELTRVVLILQRIFRGFLGKRKAKAKQDELEKERIFLTAIINIQRFFRGFKGRKRFEARKDEYLQETEMHKAATKVQALARRDAAQKEVEKKRQEKLQKMHDAATFVRKLWLSHITRKRFLELKKEFSSHIDSIVVMQRYVRGFLVRLRMWKEAMRAEEELWAVVEIQRVFRGLLGRIRWEDKFAETYKKEMAAFKMQVWIRGWLARIRVNKKQRKVARQEFDKARARFRAAQKIQALIRGVLVRKVISAWRERIISCVVTIQRIARGHALRRKLWDQVLSQRATMISSLARGFLTRKRLFHLIAKVILIQRFYKHLRRWETKKMYERRMKLAQDRKAAAKAIQSKYKDHQQDKDIKNIKAAEAEETAKA
eukprot:gnl/MRDRNA2_/MRDRNA2_99375_c0_seq1.p1 gnl/MRDRNA2_/MRDRNA2_99375_c0~~gnl/MRDRNA2_/MRDRNA2_99375_c0_seq1.p1  ORF type:complete len:914 (+),score=214.10 gnl/MRDRNA2_/MRDRNA2_99375_c0_seq1:107-2848(+)